MGVGVGRGGGGGGGGSGLWEGVGEDTKQVVSIWNDVNTEFVICF